MTAINTDLKYQTLSLNYQGENKKDRDQKGQQQKKEEKVVNQIAKRGFLKEERYPNKQKIIGHEGHKEMPIRNLKNCFLLLYINILNII